MDNNIKLYLVRHGQTEWNVQERFQGQLDSPLTKNGIEKIEKTGEKLSKIKFSNVYTSQMNRTIETAKILLEKNEFENKNIEKLQLNKIEELNEIHFGIWQGMTYKEIFEKYPEEGNNYFYNVKEYNAEKINGENLKKGLERFLKGIYKIIENNKNGGNILVVTHGTVLELFLHYVENKESNELDERKLMTNGDYKIFTYENNKFLELKNE